MAAALTVRGVAVEGPPVAAFQGLDFEVAAGEAAGLTALGAMDLGRLLDVLAGLEPPAAGEVVWGAVSSRKLEEERSEKARYHLARRIRLEVGLLSATASLLQNRTIEDNITLPLRYHAGYPEEEVTTRMSGLTRMLDIAAFARERPASLTAGVRRRAELARALILKPRILILDAPFAGVDRGSARVMREVLGKYREEGMAILTASPDPLELVPFSSRVLVLDGGRLAGILEGKDLLDPAFLTAGEAMLGRFRKEEGDRCAPRSAG